MHDNVLVMVADNVYMPHVRSLMVQCRRMGTWEGDFAIIMPQGTDPISVEERGIDLLVVPERGFRAKFQVFSPYFRKWKAAFYLDCDIIIQGPIRRAFDQLAQFPLLPDGTRPIVADLEDTPAIMSWRNSDPHLNEHEPRFRELIERFPHVGHRFWNTAFLLFEPASIPKGTVESLNALQDQWQDLNPIGAGGTDQHIIHLLLFDKFREKQEKIFCFWGLDEPNARVPSDFRGWKGDEVPMAVHYCRWYAPWLPRKPSASGYVHSRLNVPCRDIYHNALSAFNETFPRKSDP